MGDDHDRALVLAQRTLQPGDALGVEVVRRLVEQQQVGLLQQQAAQRHAAPLSAREVRHRALGWRAAQRVEGDVDAAVEVPAVLGVDPLLQLRLLGEERVHLLVVHRLGELLADRVEAVDRGFEGGEGLHHVLADRLVRVELGLLLQVADAHALRGPSLAAELLLDPGHDLEQRALARAVDAEHADLDARQEGQRDPLEHLAPARESLGHVLHHVDVLVSGHPIPGS